MIRLVIIAVLVNTIVFCLLCGWITGPDDDQEKGTIVFVSKIDGKLYTGNLDGTGIRRIHISGITDNINPPEYQDRVDDSTIMSFGTPRWSPDGNRIAVSVYVATDQSQLIVMDADGGNARAASPNTQMTSYVDWSPDGTKITYSMSTSIWGAAKEIFITDLTTDTWKQVTGNLSHLVGNLTSPRWTEDGEFIFFLAGGGQTLPDILYRYSIAADSSEVITTIPDYGEISYASIMTRNGIYVFETDQSDDVVRYNTQSGVHKVITQGDRYLWPRLSYDDRWVFLTRNYGPHNYEIYLVTPDGDDLHILASFEDLIYGSYEMDIYRY